MQVAVNTLKKRQTTSESHVTRYQCADHQAMPGSDICRSSQPRQQQPTTPLATRALVTTDNRRPTRHPLAWLLFATCGASLAASVFPMTKTAPWPPHENTASMMTIYHHAGLVFTRAPNRFVHRTGVFKTCAPADGPADAPQPDCTALRREGDHP